MSEKIFFSDVLTNSQRATLAYALTHYLDDVKRDEDERTLRTRYESTLHSLDMYSLRQALRALRRLLRVSQSLNVSSSASSVLDVLELYERRTVCEKTLADILARKLDMSALSFIELMLNNIVQALDERERNSLALEAHYARTHAQRMLSRK